MENRSSWIWRNLSEACWLAVGGASAINKLGKQHVHSRVVGLASPHPGVDGLGGSCPGFQPSPLCCVLTNGDSMGSPVSSEALPSQPYLTYTLTHRRPFPSHCSEIRPSANIFGTEWRKDTNAQSFHIKQGWTDNNDGRQLSFCNWETALWVTCFYLTVCKRETHRA